MLSSHGNDRSYVIICQRIKNRFSVSAGLHQFILLEDTKLMGHCGLGHVQDLCQITNTHFRFKQHKQDSDSGGICKYLKQICQIIQLLFVRHGLIHDL